MVDEDEDRRATLELRAAGELTDPDPGSRRDARVRAEESTALFTALGALPEPVREALFGPSSQWALFAFYADGPVQVGVVLDPPLSVHAPSLGELERQVREVIAEHRGVVAADVHAFGKRVPREAALTALRDTDGAGTAEAGGRAGRSAGSGRAARPIAFRTA